MEAYFSNLFEDVRDERSLILLLSLTDPDVLKQSKIYWWWNKYFKKSRSWKITPPKMFVGTFCFKNVRKTVLWLLNGLSKYKWRRGVFKTKDSRWRN